MIPLNLPLPCPRRALRLAEGARLALKYVNRGS